MSSCTNPNTNIEGANIGNLYYFFIEMEVFRFENNGRWISNQIGHTFLLFDYKIYRLCSFSKILFCSLEGQLFLFSVQQKKENRVLIFICKKNVLPYTTNCLIDMFIV